MGLWSKEQLRSFIKENLVTAQEAQNAKENLFADTLQGMLEAELDTIWAMRSMTCQISRQGTAATEKSKKKITSEYGEQEIFVTRDRLGEFKPLVVRKHQSNVTGICSE